MKERDLWIWFISAPQIIIYYLFLIYAIALSIKLCKVDINLSRWKHVHNVETAEYLIMNGQQIHHWSFQVEANLCQFPEQSWKQKIMIWKMRKNSNKKHLGDELLNLLESNLEVEQHDRSRDIAVSLKYFQRWWGHFASGCETLWGLSGIIVRLMN